MREEAINLENTDSYISSPFSLPPFESLSPLPSPEMAPPFCVCPPFSPQSPSTPTYTPPVFQAPPTFSPAPHPPEFELPSPPKHAPSPPKSAPSPPAFKPPVILPPPSTPPPPHKAAPQYAVWCVAKPTVPDPIIQEAMDYACGKGADCEAIKPEGECFQPNTLFSHASYAFNSYWQRTKVAGGTCDFGGTAMLVTANPSKAQHNSYTFHLKSKQLSLLWLVLILTASYIHNDDCCRFQSMPFCLHLMGTHGVTMMMKTMPGFRGHKNKAIKLGEPRSCHGFCSETCYKHFVRSLHTTTIYIYMCVLSFLTSSLIL